MEIIEILDSDEEGDERVRIVQQRHEPNLRPIQEEGNGDGDVIITGTRGGDLLMAGGQRERKRSSRLAGVFFSFSCFFLGFKNREREIWVPKFWKLVRSRKKSLFLSLSRRLLSMVAKYPYSHALTENVFFLSAFAFRALFFFFPCGCREK
jgi:hypothetical protein